MENNSGSGASEGKGVIILSGAFVTRHKETLLTLAHMTEDLCSTGDPGVRIVDVVENGSSVKIETTVQSLATRIGERLCAVCGGSVVSESGESDLNYPRLVWSRAS